MLIGIITNLYPPYARGGAEMVLVRTVGELLAQGHEVFVIAGQPRSAGKGVMRDASSGERIYRFFPRNVYFSLDDHRHAWPIRILWHLIDTFFSSAPRQIRSILQEERPDIVITHNLKGIGLNVPRMLRELDLPHVHVVHDLQLIFPSGLLMFGHETPHWALRIPHALYQNICRRLFRSPDVVIFPSTYLEQQYRTHRFFPQSTLIHLPNPAPNYPPIAHVPRDGHEPLTLFFIAQLVEHKGIALLFAALAKCRVPLRLFIAGDGPLARWVAHMAAQDPRVTYMGYTQQEEVCKIFGVVDAMVVPSLCYENSPTTIYESLQMGVPVIAARIGGVGELVEEGKNGVLFTPGDVHDLTRAIEDLSTRRREFAGRREAIRASVAAHALPLYTAHLVAILRSAIVAHRDRGSAAASPHDVLSVSS